MPQYRERETGTVKSHSEIKKIHSNVSFSSVVDTFADLGWDKLVEVARPEASSILKLVEEDAPVEEESEVLRDVLIEPQATPVTEEKSSEPVAEEESRESVADEDGWIEITSKGFSEDSKWESSE